MSDQHGEHDISTHVRVYLIVFGALLIGTILTVAAAYIHINTFWNITIALIIACVKGFLVAGYFMHLVSEKMLIYTVLAFTVFFFIGMMFLTVYAKYDIPMLTGS
jgi:cytochrome c oxidase subunit 4